ncbi:MAG: hypothetical protein RR654_10545, partial [Oscillospiraceae bacterium]
MSKVISVWGSVGCGKSVVSIALAHELNTEKANVIVISFDKTSPMFSSYLPFQEFDVANNSIGTLLLSEINKINLKGKLNYNERNSRTAFMSLGITETYQKYPDKWITARLERLVTILDDFADYIILDLTSNFLIDNATFWSLANSDTVIELISPDNKGLSFIDSYFPLLVKDSRFQTDKFIKAISNAYLYSPYEQIMKERSIEI